MRKLASSLALAAVVLALGAAPAHAQLYDGMIAVPTLTSVPVVGNLVEAVQDSTDDEDVETVDINWIAVS